MKLSYVTELSKRPISDILILPFWEEKHSAIPACELKELKTICEFPIQKQDFRGKNGEVLILYPHAKKESRIALLGIGKKEEFSAEHLRRAYAAVIKICQKKSFKKLNLSSPHIGNKFKEFSVIDAVMEGVFLTNYCFDQLKSKTSKHHLPELIEQICIIGITAEEFSKCSEAQIIVDAVNLTRDLVNGNAKDVTPEFLGKTASYLAEQFKSVKTTIFDKKMLQKLGMNLLLAVNQGSLLEPAFILIEYRGNPKTSDLTAIVGKGITYDTGGLNLKPTGSMETMKDDMAGAAAVLGVIQAAAALKLPVNILGAIATTENSISATSYKPGDVYSSYSGKTVEISNTDAEGRLVLADALSYIQDHYKISRIIDLATLTGGIIIALGHEATGIFSNNDQLANGLIRSGSRTYERLWRLPIFSEYQDHLKSSIADIKNSGDRKASSGTAAFFLQEFIQKQIPWAHLDIAGTSYLPTPQFYHTTPATGIGVRLLIDFLRYET